MVQEIELICFDNTCVYNNPLNNLCSNWQPFLEVETERTCRCLSYEEKDVEEDN